MTRPNTNWVRDVSARTHSDDGLMRDEEKKKPQREKEKIHPIINLLLHLKVTYRCGEEDTASEVSALAGQ